MPVPLACFPLRLLLILILLPSSSVLSFFLLLLFILCTLFITLVFVLVLVPANVFDILLGLILLLRMVPDLPVAVLPGGLLGVGGRFLCPPLFSESWEYGS